METLTSKSTNYPVSLDKPCDFAIRRLRLTGGLFTTIDKDNRWCYHVDGTVREGRADSAKTEFVYQ
ncbi:MAG: hypothetical protein H8D32_00630 [Dehalococcoidia bacterium]|nr:hypothetical protein [Dehalococcoidia bacterium]